MLSNIHTILLNTPSPCTSLGKPTFSKSPCPSKSYQIYCQKRKPDAIFITELSFIPSTPREEDFGGTDAGGVVVSKTHRHEPRVLDNCWKFLWPLTLNAQSPILSTSPGVNNACLKRTFRDFWWHLFAFSLALLQDLINLLSVCRILGNYVEIFWRNERELLIHDQISEFCRWMTIRNDGNLFYKSFLHFMMIRILRNHQDWGSTCNSNRNSKRTQIICSANNQEEKMNFFGYLHAIIQIGQKRYPNSAIHYYYYEE